MAGQRKLTSFFSKQLSPSDPPDQEGDPEEDTSLVSNSQDGPAAASEIRNDELHPAKKQRTLFHPLDIGNFVRKDLTSESALTDEQRYEALVNAWKPDVNHHFPKISESGRNRCFQHGYLDKWPWLAYSEMHGGGAFCKHCILFAKAESSKRGGHRSLGVLVTHPLAKFKKALQVLNTHDACEYHREASESAKLFLEWHENPTSRDVRNRLMAGREQQALRNRQRLIPIIKTIQLCGRQNIPLRGHRENGDLLNPDETVNDGNFRALLRFRLDAGVTSLEEHLINAKQKATYVGNRFQNEVIEAIGKIIRRKFVEEISSAKFFSVLADESRDAGKTDQLSICLRYVGVESGKHVLKEVFLKFCEVVDKTGAGLARTIMDNLESEGLDVRNLRGRGYDGASAMSGQYRGVQAEIKVPEALYFHCASHCLNLALVHSAKVVGIRLAAGIVGSTGNFFSGSSARIRLLEVKVEALVPTSHRRRLKALCATRWVESHHAFITFKELLMPIVHSLRELSQQMGEIGVRAYQLLNSVCKCEFLVSLYIIESFSSLLLPLSVGLQAKQLDIFAALSMVDNVLVVLKQRRDNAHMAFRALFEELEEICPLFDVDLRRPRICERQTARENHPAETAEDYFRVSYYLQYLDSLIEGFVSLFADARHGAVRAQYLVPKFVVNSTFEDLTDTLEFYKSDLDCSVSIMRGEFERWKAMWLSVHPAELPGTAIDALNQCASTEFPKIALLLQIFATLPVTTSSAERTFSALRLLKTYLRTVMGNDRLNGLASMCIERKVKVAPEEVLDVIALNPKKLDIVL